MQTLLKFLQLEVTKPEFIEKMECTQGIADSTDLVKFENCLAHDKMDIKLADAYFEIIGRNLLILKMVAKDGHLIPDLIIKDFRG